MKTINLNFILIALVGLVYSCEVDLDETPLSSLSADNVLTSPEGFDSYLNGLVWAAREEMGKDDNTFFITNFPGTDVGEDAGAEYYTYRDWRSYMTPINDEVLRNWEWAYKTLLPQANTIIVYANKESLDDIWENEEQKNAVIAEARFFRGYAYNYLANLYGGVPIVDTIQASPKFDHVRNTRQEVYEFVKADLEFASQWLPETVSSDMEGHIVKAAADHLLTEVNISLGLYEEAIQSASRVIDSGLYELMSTRFGQAADSPGDVFSDLFVDGNFNRQSGNREAIYVWQFEGDTDGGGATVGGNKSVRNLCPFLTKIVDPAGYSNVATDTLGRGVGRVRGTNYSLYDIWDDPNDIRNSEYNMRRKFYYNNPSSPYYGEQITGLTNAEDTLRRLYIYPRKAEGTPWVDNTSGTIDDDVYVYRLAETYLLRAEAYMNNGDYALAAADINKVRERAHAAPITSAQVSIDYILDERARELLFEEPRRRTLIRLGLLVPRVREYGLMESWRSTIQDYQNLWPIPQDVIDSNYGAVITQNPGY